MVRSIWRFGLAMSVVAGTASAAAAQVDPPLRATFRCVNSTECPAGEPPDGIQGYPTSTYDGYETFRKKGTTYIDGAYLNSNGGISLRFVPGGTSPDRVLQFRFGPRVSSLAPANLPSVCNVDGFPVNATDVDFRFNVSRPDGTGGIESMGEGDTIGPSDTGEATVVGVVNFTTTTIRGSLYFNYSKDAITSWDGEAILTREVSAENSDVSTWTLKSNSTVLLQCAAGSKGKLYDVGTYHMPFQLTVEK